MDSNKIKSLILLLFMLKFIQIQRNRRLVRNFILCGQLTRRRYLHSYIKFCFKIVLQINNLIGNFILFSIRNQIAKIQSFYEVTVPRMIPRYFRRYFRMYTEGLSSLINYLAPSTTMTLVHENTRIPLEKQVAMTTAYLGSKWTTLT